MAASWVQRGAIRRRRPALGRPYGCILLGRVGQLVREHQISNLVLWTKRGQESDVSPDAVSGDDGAKLRPHCHHAACDGRGCIPEALPRPKRAARSAQSDQSRSRRRRSGALVEDVEGGDRQMQQCPRRCPSHTVDHGSDRAFRLDLGACIVGAASTSPTSNDAFRIDATVPTWPLGYHLRRSWRRRGSSPGNGPAAWRI
jgi:hypothetical protein